MADEMKNVINTDFTEQMAEGMVPCAVSRRDRRKHNSARAVENAKAVEEVITESRVPSLFDDASAVSVSDEPLPETDEPTRIFKLATKRDAEGTPEPEETRIFKQIKEEKSVVPAPVFSGAVDVTEESEEKKEPVEIEDEDDDEEEEEKEKKREFPRPFFGRRKASRYDDDEDDEDDEDEDDEDDDDEEDDYDRMDDDDDDDDDDEHRSFGYHLINFFKGLLEFVLVLLVIVLALNVLDFFNVVSLDGAFDRYYNKAPGVFDTLFPSHKLKKPAQETTAATETETPNGFEAALAPETAGTAASAQTDTAAAGGEVTE